MMNSESGKDWAESWIIEMVLPGVFTIVLALCLGHLALCIFEAQAEQAAGPDYAISAFAN